LQDHLFIGIKEGLTKDDKVVVGPYSALSRTLENGTKVTPNIERKLVKPILLIETAADLCSVSLAKGTEIYCQSHYVRT